MKLDHVSHGHLPVSSALSSRVPVVCDRYVMGALHKMLWRFPRDSREPASSVSSASSPSGSVYFIRSGDFVKIGYSRDPEKRLRQMDNYLSCAPILAAVFPGTRATETKLHRFLSRHHARREWFKWCEEIADIVETGLPDLSHIGPRPHVGRKRGRKSGLRKIAGFYTYPEASSP